MDGAWHRTNRLPVKSLAPPTADQIKWLIRGWGEYVICDRKRLWRMPHVNGQGRNKSWKQVLLIQKKEGYTGANFWRDGVRYYYSIPQLRRLLSKNSAYTGPDKSENVGDGTLSHGTKT